MRISGKIYRRLPLFLDDHPHRARERVGVEVGQHADLVEGREDALLVPLGLVPRALLERLDGPVRVEVQLHRPGRRHAAPVLYLSEARRLAAEGRALPPPDVGGTRRLLDDDVDARVEVDGMPGRKEVVTRNDAAADNVAAGIVGIVAGIVTTTVIVAAGNDLGG